MSERSFPTASRRQILETAGSAAATFATLRANQRVAAASGNAAAPQPRSDDALQRLLEGNRQYVLDQHAFDMGRRGQERRQEVAESQEPFALILGCADSRVSPEVLFNQGIGDLFVIRVAGNFVTERCFGVLGSIEYAVQFLHVPLIMVLGHERCGAVKAAVDLAHRNERPPGNIGIIADEIRPALEDIDRQTVNTLDYAIAANVRLNAARLAAASDIVGQHVLEGKTRIVGAVYDLDTGEVTLTTPTV